MRENKVTNSRNVQKKEIVKDSFERLIGGEVGEIVEDSFDKIEEQDKNML